MSYLAVIGEAVADAFVQPKSLDGALDLRVRPGGSPANVAVALARLGAPTRFIGRLSRGIVGELLRDHLVASGVDVSWCVAAAEEATLAVTAVDVAGNASYDFYARGTADWEWTGDELASRRPTDAACVHVGSLALVLEPGATHITNLLGTIRERVTISIDPNVRQRLVPGELYRERLAGWCALADILRLSDEDLATLAPGSSLEAACDDLHEAGVRLVVVTQGGRGALASLDGVRVRMPAFAVEVVDTVGAGDSFTAGLLHWLWRHGRLADAFKTLTVPDVENATRFAARVAGLTCGVAGADAPWANDLRQVSEP